MSTMKRLAVLVKGEKVDAIITSLRELDLEATIYDVKSAGKEKEKTRTGRGTSVMDRVYVSRKIIATIVESNRIQEVSAAIKKAMGDESKGVIIISPIDDFAPF